MLLPRHNSLLLLALTLGQFSLCLVLRALLTHTPQLAVSESLTKYSGNRSRLLVLGGLAGLDSRLIVLDGHGLGKRDLLDTFALLLGAITSLGPLAGRVAREDYKLGLVQLQALDVCLEGLLAPVFPAVIHSDAKATGLIAIHLGSCKLVQGESTASAHFHVVLVGRASDDGTEGAWEKNKMSLTRGRDATKLAGSFSSSTAWYDTHNNKRGKIYRRG